MKAPQAGALERGMVQCSRPQLALRNHLSQRYPRLDRLTGHAALSGVTLGAGERALEEACWRLSLGGPAGPFLQIGIVPAVAQALGLSEALRPALRRALAAQVLAPMLPVLRGLGGGELEFGIDASPDWSDTQHWAKFHLSLPAMHQMLPARAPDPVAAELPRLIGGRLRGSPLDVPVTLWIGSRVLLPARDAARLRPGDVLLGDEPGPARAGTLDLFTPGAQQPLREGRCLARVRLEDGRVEHLARAAWIDAGLRPSAHEPMVGLHVVEGALRLPASVCRALTIGQRIEAWPQVAWHDQAELRLCGRRVGHARRIRVAGRWGHEVTALRAGSQAHEEA